MTVSFEELHRSCLVDNRVIRSKFSSISYIYVNELKLCEKEIAQHGQKALLRGEVAFERWFFHYESEASTKGLGHALSRVWAVAYAIESTVKYLLTKLPLLYYEFRIDHGSVHTNGMFDFQQKYNVLKYAAPAQGSSALYSLLAVLFPEAARHVYIFNNATPTQDINGMPMQPKISAEFLQKRVSECWGTVYKGKSELRNVFNRY